MAKTRKHLHNKRHSRSKNIVKRGFKKGIQTSKKGFKKGLGMVKSTIPMVKSTIPMVKSTSKKYMPKVKTGLESVGSKVTKTATKSVPILQKASRDLLGIIGIKKKN